MKRDLLGVVEAAYGLDVPDAQWLQNVGARLGPFMDRGLGLIAWIYQQQLKGSVVNGQPVGINAAPENLRAVTAVNQEAGTAALSPGYSEPGALTLASQSFGQAGWRALGERFATHGFQKGWTDALILNVQDATGMGAIFTAGIKRSVRIGQPSLWPLVSAHLAAGLRLRGLHLAKGTVEKDAEALLTPEGRVEHAEGQARSLPARQALRRAVIAAERARGSLRRTDEARAMSLWQGLVDGRWSLIDRFDSDNRRFVVAVRNDPRFRKPRQLSPREALILRLAVMGHPAKLIAYELGFGVGTITSCLSVIRKRMGARSTAELIELAGRLPKTR